MVGETQSLKVLFWFFQNISFLPLRELNLSIFLETPSVIHPDISVPVRCLRIWHMLFFWFWFLALLLVLAFELLYHHIVWKSGGGPSHLPNVTTHFTKIYVPTMLVDLCWNPEVNTPVVGKHCLLRALLSYGTPEKYQVVMSIYL